VIPAARHIWAERLGVVREGAVWSERQGGERLRRGSRLDEPVLWGVCEGVAPALTKGVPLAGRGVEAKLLATTKRKNGTLRVTYNGHPLYYYSADKVGKIMCQHANMHGGLWLVIKPNGQPNTAKSKMHM
jgi:hypothetical protein